MAVKAKTYVFGEFRFVPYESLLLRSGEAVPLPPKALRLLDKLVENAGSLVTKDDLIRDVWDDLAIEESAIPRTVFAVRAALGDDPKSHTFIQTIPKRGYRFVADVSTLNGSGNGDIPLGPNDPATPSSDVAVLKASRTERPRPSFLVRIAFALSLLAAVGIGVYVVFTRNAASSVIPSLLVMPVTPAGGPNGDEFLENGIADALIHHIAASTTITVRPLSVTRSYSEKTTDPVQAGREQKVQKVLSATYQRAGGKVRVLATLVDVDSARTEEFYRFETGESGIFAIQDAIAADLGNKVAVTLGASSVPVRSSGTGNEEAYRYYLQGMALFDMRNGAKAVESFEHALELDPNYSRAWTGKAVALGTMPSLGGATSSELYERSVKAVERAIELDPVSGDSYSALCGAKLTYAHDLAGAEQACTKAMELAPNSPIVLQSYSFFLVTEGRLDEALEVIKAALDVEPTSFFSHTDYAHALHLARKYDEAYEQYVRLTELQPNRLPTYEWMIRALEANGREAEAMEWLIRSMRIRNVDEKLVTRVQQAYQVAGWPGVLRERLALDKDSMNYFRQAGFNARLGEKDAAFDLLEKAYQQRLPVFVTLRVEPQFDPLRDDPRYHRLIERLESGAR